jgi:hypothetical protein
MEFQRFLQIGESLFLGLALTRDVYLQALGNVPFPLAHDGRRKWPLHEIILP